MGNFIDNVLIAGGCDFGDAPDSYGTTYGAGGAFHTADSQVYMGSVFGDSETDATGYYQFDSVVDGGYEVYQAAGETVPVPQNCGVAFAANPAGYTSTTPDSLGFIMSGANVTAGWTREIYRDSNCDGALDSSEANTPIQGLAYPIAAGGELCILNRVSAPSNVLAGEMFNVTTSAAFNYAGGGIAPASLQVFDETVAGQAAITPEQGESSLELIKTVENLTQLTAETDSLNQANPGDSLKYRIYYRNTGSGSITDLDVNDSLPAYTSFVTSSCDVTPSGMTCTPLVASDGLSWDFSGPLIGGSSGQVSFEVKVNN